MLRSGEWRIRGVDLLYNDIKRKMKRQERKTMSEFKFEIIQKIGVLSKSASGWEKQLNLMRWNEREPKYDIREWAPDGEKMGKGVTLSKEELLVLKDILNKIEL